MENKGNQMNNSIKVTGINFNGTKATVILNNSFSLKGVEIKEGKNGLYTYLTPDSSLCPLPLDFNAQIEIRRVVLLNYKKAA